MTTRVGNQSFFSEALYELCELDFDAIEAYEAAIRNLESSDYKLQLSEFKKDHQRHTEELKALLKKHDAKYPNGPSIKNILTQGKVIMGKLLGDQSILKAMHSNEIDTNTAYERLNQHDGKWQDSEDILRRGLMDEKKHKQWLEDNMDD